MGAPRKHPRRPTGQNKAEERPSIAELLPEIERYNAERIGGAERIRHMGRRLGELGLCARTKTKRHVPYRHQRVVQERRKREEERAKQDLLAQGLYRRKKRDAKEEIRKKRRY